MGTGLALRVGWRETMDPIETDMKQISTPGSKPYSSPRTLKVDMQLRSTKLGKLCGVTWERISVQTNRDLLDVRDCAEVKI